MLPEHVRFDICDIIERNIYCDDDLVEIERIAEEIIKLINELEER